MKNYNLFDVIIVNYNSTDCLLACLESLSGALKNIPAEIFIEDNASEDNVDRLIPAFPQIHLTKNRTNLGFSKAVNQALKKCSASYILLLNPDAYITEDFFEPLLKYVESNPDVGIAGPAILNADGSIQGSARSFPKLLTAFFGRSSLLSKWFPRNRFTRQNLLDTSSDGIHPMPVDWVSGACMLIRRAIFENVGSMDEQFFMYWEDADLCRRAWMKGWKVVYFPRSTLVHYAGISSRQRKMRSVFELHKSSYLFYSKYCTSFRNFFKPLVFAGLYLRLMAVLASTLLKQFLNGRQA